MSKNKDKIKRKKTLNFINKIKIKTKSLNFTDLTILISLALITFSILTPWFSIINNSAIEWIFSKIFWATGYISLLLVIINIFIIFSNKTKQRIKLFFYNSLWDNSIFIFSSLLFLILWLNSYIIIKGWISLFTNEIRIHIWIIFYLIATILYSIWVFFKLKQNNTNNNFISINESVEKNINLKWKSKNKKNVMKLPFE
jgi:hypothetical protein